MTARLLTDALPDTLTVRTRRYPAETDFRFGALLSSLFVDDRVDEKEKALLSVRLLSPPLWEAVGRGEVLLAEAFQAVLWFYTCGNPPISQVGTAELAQSPANRARTPAVPPLSVDRAFDFTYDGDRVYAAFYAVYGLDLAETTLHWWKFMALLRGLPEDCALMRVIRLRLTDTSKIADDEMRRRIRRAKAAVRLRPR